MTSETHNEAIDYRAELEDLFASPFVHLKTGISYMLPFIMISGILVMFTQFSQISDASMWKAVGEFAFIGLSFFVPFFGAFISYSIAGKAGLAPGFVVAYYANSNGSGYLGALVGGYLVGYLTVIFLRFVRTNKYTEGIWGVFAPALSTGIICLLLHYVINGPVASFSEMITAWVDGIDHSQGALLGGIYGLSNVDFGGPISKAFGVVTMAAYASGIYIFHGLAIAIIAVPPIGLCLAALLSPTLFTKGERNYSRKTMPLCFISGFTELALPLVFNDIIRCTIASVAGSVVAGAVAGGFGLELSVPIMGLPSWFFVNNVPVYALSIASGSIVTCVVMILLRKLFPRKDFDPDDEESAFDLI
ncbi:MAG: PTS fructose transporter subunit IIC [Firmicutes bacterium]|jgi:fructose-specific phosphotransferase system IIC component|nr:PTS fructose transporter subunit IIC [Bacillota bacterium]